MTLAPAGLIGGGEKYSRYAEQLSAIQGYTSTYLDDPDNVVSEDIERLLSDCSVVLGIYERIVPIEVEREVFRGRYFYRVYKLDKTGDARVSLRWDFEDDGDDDDDKIGSDNATDRERDDGQPSNLEIEEGGHGKSEEKETKVAEKDSGGDSPCKDSDLSIISSQASMPEVEDLVWEVIEDVIDDHENNRIKQVEGVSRTRKDELRKRLNSTEEEDSHDP